MRVTASAQVDEIDPDLQVAEENTKERPLNQTSRSARIVVSTELRLTQPDTRWQSASHRLDYRLDYPRNRCRPAGVTDANRLAQLLIWRSESF